LGYVADVSDSATAGFKYFDCRGVTRVKIKVRGYIRGLFEVKTSWDGEVLGAIPVEFSNIWTEYAADIAIPDGIQSIYFTFRGHGNGHFGSFTLE
jgi:arabinoxylan arabinofuranohydrolase